MSISVISAAAGVGTSTASCTAAWQGQVTGHTRSAQALTSTSNTYMCCCAHGAAMRGTRWRGPKGRARGACTAHDVYMCCVLPITLCCDLYGPVPALVLLLMMTLLSVHDHDAQHSEYADHSMASTSVSMMHRQYCTENHQHMLWMHHQQCIMVIRTASEQQA